ncbi:BTAD domain-containing putative transcriptional regulator [Trebonia sp.]|uniref:AfsR/SARP family transcriptional regulator n=1 Tax=Trebonia sp. TaxID=2767075 RepID=UPI002619BC59|nr:BTAD domain-containing putative transcriptional regulator [Trebonia sp.]
MVRLRVGVLGPVTAWRDEREVPAGQPRQLAVLGVLAMRANHVVSRGELVDAVWGDGPPASAEGGIYTYVAGLRRVLEPDLPRRDPDHPRRAPARVLVSAGGGYVLRLDPGCLDSDQFEQFLGRARGLRASGDLVGAARAVDEALALWRGLAFAGVPGPFAEAERQRLGELRTAAAEERADLLLAQGRAAEAVPELTTLAADHPLREQARGLLMIALYRCGRQAEALQVFHDVRGRLAEELGIDPSAELTNIYQQVLAMDPALHGPADMPRAGQGQLADPVAPAAPTPAQVPPETAGFAGRAAELRWLHAMVPESPGAAPGESAVAVVTGTAGVGKTALAVRFARQVAQRFPDGQLYVNLRGFDPSGAPAEPEVALRGFFEALGVPQRRVPASLEAQTGLFRSLLEGKRMLLLLDNARSTEQVRPLLPGSPSCMVVITSRSQLTGLVAAEGARPLPLQVLSEAEARELLAHRMGPVRVAAEPTAAAELIEQSAGLPLALSVACARAVTRPGVALADLAAELRDARGRLDVLETGDVTTDLRAVFSWSYQKLSERAARMFRLLGVHPKPDISVAAAASLAGTPLPAARTALAELTRASLLSEDAGGPGRFGCHELLRAYAAERAAADESEDERDAARRRLLDHYLRTAYAGSVRLHPVRSQVRLPPAVPDVTPENLGSYEAVLAWFAAEHRVLHAVLAMAAEAGFDAQCWTLAWYWATILTRSGLMHEVAELQRTALASAERLGDPVALAHVHYELGHASARVSDFAASHAHLEQALELFTRLGDHVSIAMVQYGLAALLDQEGRYSDAIEHASEALRLRRSFADRAAVASSENAVGWIYAHLGQHAEALRHCRRALELHRDSGSRGAVADTLDSIGYAYRGLADYPQAIAHYERALDLYRNIGDLDGESGSLTGLGDVQVAAGQPAAARRSWELALAVQARLPGVDSGPVRARLATLAVDGAAAGATAGTAAAGAVGA